MFGRNLVILSVFVLFCISATRAFDDINDELNSMLMGQSTVVSMDFPVSSVFDQLKDMIDNSGTILSSVGTKTETCIEFHERYNSEKNVSKDYSGPTFNDLAVVDNYECPLNIDENSRDYDFNTAARVDALLSKLARIARPSFSERTRRVVDVSTYVNGHRCHLTAWGNLRNEAVASLQNGDLNAIFQLARRLFSHRDGKIDSNFFGEQRYRVLTNLRTVCDYAKGVKHEVYSAHEAFLELLATLNSSIPNLRPGHGYTNSKIGEKFDFHVVNGHITAAEHSRFHQMVASNLTSLIPYVANNTVVYDRDGKPITKSSNGRFVYTSTGDLHTQEKNNYCVSWVRNL